MLRLHLLPESSPFLICDAGASLFFCVNISQAPDFHRIPFLPPIAYNPTTKSLEDPVRNTGLSISTTASNFHLPPIPYFRLSARSLATEVVQ
jgi:hypothetical protein